MSKKKDDYELSAELAKDMVQPVVPLQETIAIEDMPLETLGDYIRYNAKARMLNKKLGLCRYRAKQCPIELHPSEKIVFSRNDQPNNKLPVYLSNDIIEFKKILEPGKTYDLPRVVIQHLSEKGVPVWKWFTNADGSKETRVSHKDPRFALRTVYKD